MTTSLRDIIKQNRLNDVAERRASLTPLDATPTAAPDPPVIRRPMVPPQSNKPQWQRFNRTQPRRVNGGLHVSIHKGGRNIVLSGDALMALSLPHAVEVHFCGDPWMIGFRTARTDDDQAYTLLPSKGVARAISCSAFIQRIGVDTSVGRRYRASMQGDMLVVSLAADNATETGPRE